MQCAEDPRREPANVFNVEQEEGERPFYLTSRDKEERDNGIYGRCSWESKRFMLTSGLGDWGWVVLHEGAEVPVLCAIASRWYTLYQHQI